jgi:hypothetical protein
METETDALFVVPFITTWNKAKGKRVLSLEKKKN